MIDRVTKNPEYEATFNSAMELAETMYEQIAKYREDVAEFHSWSEWQMAMRMLGSKLLRPCAGFKLPPLEET